MNAHQRRVHRRSLTTFDIEAFPMIAWEKLRKLVMKSVRPTGPALTVTGRNEGIIFPSLSFSYVRSHEVS
jgi:hypothetical protein